jgi:hypothetical protein
MPFFNTSCHWGDDYLPFCHKGGFQLHIIYESGFGFRHCELRQKKNIPKRAPGWYKKWNATGVHRSNSIQNESIL